MCCSLNLCTSYELVQSLWECKEINQWVIMSDSWIKVKKIIISWQLTSELSVSCNVSLQQLQNCAACIILPRETCREAFGILNWIDLATSQQMHKCILVYKCMYDLALTDLSHYFTRNSSIHTYNIRHKNYLHLSSTKLTLGIIFRFSGSLIFNSLSS